MDNYGLSRFYNAEFGKYKRICVVRCDVLALLKPQPLCRTLSRSNYGIKGRRWRGCASLRVVCEEMRQNTQVRVVLSKGYECLYGEFELFGDREARCACWNEHY